MPIRNPNSFLSTIQFPFRIVRISREREKHNIVYKVFRIGDLIHFLSAVNFPFWIVRRLCGREKYNIVSCVAEKACGKDANSQSYSFSLHDPISIPNCKEERNIILFVKACEKLAKSLRNGVVLRAIRYFARGDQSCANWKSNLEFLFSAKLLYGILIWISYWR